ncbi:Ubiquitin carboxyl-terminal hydrolase BAP1 [Trichoplax sp. H2]|nr:Ubiquitin carboxyl-terminal hydrolase BAP1 [Trichoplax sp. H2]|eukprot:RDD42942.1 Ubiquitin carboxyl-terminal hydrolase BAP1 [Trichoplax sp. H2]
MANSDGWRELESDPGLFTLLIEDMGVTGVEVEEIYDLSEPFDRKIYGFIFLFKWTKDRRSRRMMQEQLQAEQYAYDTTIANRIFFAQQLIPNSCATHALLSILLNSPSIEVGETLSEFRQFTKDHNPEVKGLAIGNVSKLVKAHNNHARPENRHVNTRGSVSHGQSAESFHFVSYLPIDDHLYELDGLKPYPIDHGVLPEGENWTEMFRRVIKARLGMETNNEPCHDIRYNLMSIVADKRTVLLKRMYTLVNCQNIMKAAIVKANQLTKDLQRKSRHKYGKKSEPADEEKKLAKILKEIYAESNNNRVQEIDNLDGTISHNNCKNESTFQLNDEISTGSLDSSEATGTSEEKCNQDGQNNVHDTLTNERTAKTACPFDSIESNYAQKLKNDSVKENGANKQKQKRSANGVKDDFKAKKRKQKKTSDDVKLINGVADSIINKIITTIGAKYGLLKVSNDTTFIDKNRKFLKKNIKALDAAPSPSKVIDVIAELFSDRLQEIHMSYLNIIWDQITRESKVKSYSKFNAIHHEHNYFKSTSDFFLPPEIKILTEMNKNLEVQVKICDTELCEEIDKRKRYIIDNCRRIHNYDPFISTFLKMLADTDSLSELVERNCELSKRQIRYGKKSLFNTPRGRTNKPKSIKRKGKGSEI